jgi:hypothetical protein
VNRPLLNHHVTFFKTQSDTEKEVMSLTSVAGHEEKPQRDEKDAKKEKDAMELQQTR